MLLRFSIFNSVMAFIVAYLVYFHDAFNLLLQYDLTKFSFFIFGIYVLLTAYIGIARYRVNERVVHFISTRLTSIGLVGTVIGIMILMHTVGVANLTNVSDIVSHLFLGMSTVLITTAFGMTFSLLTDYQMLYVLGDISNDD